jgi:hypothetical protein
MLVVLINCICFFFPLFFVPFFPFFLQLLLFSQVLQISSIDEDQITEETYLHLRARRSSLSGFSRRSWGGGGGRRGSSMSGSLRGSVSGSISGSFADGGEADQLYEDDPTLLPPGWSIMVDATTKKAYYWNEVSGEMTRLKPIWTRTFAPSTEQQSLTPSKSTQLLQGIDEGEEETTVQGIGRMHVRIRSFSDEAM